MVIWSHNKYLARNHIVKVTLEKCQVYSANITRKQKVVIYLSINHAEARIEHEVGQAQDLYIEITL